MITENTDLHSKIWAQFAKTFIYSVLGVYIFYIILFLVLKYFFHDPLALPLSVLIIGGCVTGYVTYILTKATFNYENIFRLVLLPFLVLITIVCLFNSRINHAIFLLYIPIILLSTMVYDFKKTVLLTLLVLFLCLIMDGFSQLLGISINTNYYKNKDFQLNSLTLIITIVVAYNSLLILYFKQKIDKVNLNNYTGNYVSPINLFAEENENETDDKYQILHDKVIQCFENDQLFQDPNLTMKHIADRLETNTTYLSKALNQIGNKRFTQLVNDYRVKYVLTEIENNSHKRFTIEHIYSQAGFSQQSTFNRIFKEYTGKTPTEYIENKN